MGFCTRCGASSGEGLRFCTNCGAPVAAPAAMPPAPGSAPGQPSPGPAGPAPTQAQPVQGLPPATRPGLSGGERAPAPKRFGLWAVSAFLVVLAGLVAGGILLLGKNRTPAPGGEDARVAAAMAMLRNIASAEVAYSSKIGNQGSYGTLADLAAQNFLEQRFRTAGPVIDGFRYEATVGNGVFQVTATPDGSWGCPLYIDHQLVVQKGTPPPLPGARNAPAGQETPADGARGAAAGLKTRVTEIVGYSETGDSLVFRTTHGEFYMYTAGGEVNMDKAELLDESRKNGTYVLLTASEGLVSDVRRAP